MLVHGWLNLPPTLDQAGWETLASSAARLIGVAGPRERLQATIDELESSNEEMKSANEEYQSVNEELQSTNEELETSKEEMQSINEELQTVNAELNSMNDQLMRSVSDLTNLKNSTQIATIILDAGLHIRDFTPL